MLLLHNHYPATAAPPQLPHTHRSQRCVRARSSCCRRRGSADCQQRVAVRGPVTADIPADMHAAAGGRKRVRSTRSASTISDSSETAVAGADAATDASVDSTADTATSTPTGELAATGDTAHVVPPHTAALGAFDDGNGRGKRTKTRRGGAIADTMKAEESTAATNGHTAQSADDDRNNNATLTSLTAAATAPPPVITADTGAATLRQATRSPSTTQSTALTPLTTGGHTHQVVHSDPPDSRSVPPTHPLNVGASIPVHPHFPTSSRGYVAYFYWYHSHTSHCTALHCTALHSTCDAIALTPPPRCSAFA